MASRRAALPSLVVHNLPGGVDQEKIKIFFLLSKNGGSGDVEDVTYPLDGGNPNSARVTFIHASTVIRICNGERKMQKNTLRLQAESVQQKQEALITAVLSKKEESHVTTPEAKQEEKDEGKRVRYTACIIHSDEFRRAVCKTCKDEPLVCFRCLISDHKNHDFTDLEEEVKAKKTEVDNLVSGNSELDSTQSDMKARLSRTGDKLEEAEKLRYGDLMGLIQAKDKALADLKEEYNKLLALIEKDFDARQKSIMDKYVTAQKDIETKWKAEIAEIQASVKALGDKIEEMNRAKGDCQDLTKPFDLVVLRRVKEEVEKALTGLADLRAASDRPIASPARPVDLAQYSSLTVEVLKKQKPAASTCQVSPRANSLLIRNVPEHMDDTDLHLFFNNKKNGGEGNVDDVIFLVDVAHPRTARIVFDDPETVRNICSKQRRYDHGEVIDLTPE